MKLKHICSIVFLITSWVLTSQIFQDNLKQETIGDFPSQWDAISGMATVNQQDGLKYISFRNGGVIKPIVNDQTNNYLSSDFTVEFDVFFNRSSNMAGQRFEIRLWDGSFGFREDNIKYTPFILYKHGLETSWNNPEIGQSKIFLKEFETFEPVWRHVKVEFIGEALNILLDNKLVLNIPTFKMQPKMMSIAGVVNDSQFEANIGLTNFVINTSDNTGTVDQIKYNKDISDEAIQKMEELMPLGIQSFSFTPNGGWVIITKNNGYFARGIPQQCFEKIKEYHNAGVKIKEVVFPPKGGNNSWLIITENDTYAKNIPQECYVRIQALKQQGKTIESVSFPYINIFDHDSDNSWVILTTDGDTFSKNIPDECYQIMQNIRQSDMPNKPSDRKITKVSFTPSGGWVVFAEDYFYTRNIPDEAFKKLGEFRGREYNNSIIAFDPDNNGWSLVADKRTKAIPVNKIREFEQNVGGLSIWNLMRQRGVPGIAVAVVINGEIAWATGYGHLIANDERYATHPESMFQAASISKVFAALGAFKLIDDGEATLDENLMTSENLKSTIPFHPCVRSAQWTQNFNRLTIRNILQHTSGIEGRGSLLDSITCQYVLPDSKGIHKGGGYKGYQDKDDSIEPYVESLNDIPGMVDLMEDITITYDPTVNRPNNIRMRVGWYSGKAFTVLQKLTQDITKTEYSVWMRDNILRPLNMNKSEFLTRPENFYDEFARGHNSKGELYLIKRYPQYAAAGLYTNALELANMIIMINDNGVFRDERILSLNAIGQLIDNDLGVNILKDESKITYSHGGINDGFKALFTGIRNINNSDGVQSAGIVILTNGDDDRDSNNDGNNDRLQFRNIISDKIIEVYDW
ncbi:serine hydrolase domain-containing protein [Psychroserpens sp. XS_ASV72]|uniref:serine hydrolase domain-containing protein n=1 Tax=Psychroserpens sp. XS_ASV72 TaxID=3241293 RepID=UPI003517A0C1